MKTLLSIMIYVRNQNPKFTFWFIGLKWLARVFINRWNAPIITCYLSLPTLHQPISYQYYIFLLSDLNEKIRVCPPKNQRNIWMWEWWSIIGHSTKQRTSSYLRVDRYFFNYFFALFIFDLLVLLAVTFPLQLFHAMLCGWDNGV